MAWIIVVIATIAYVGFYIPRWRRISSVWCCYCRRGFTPYFSGFDALAHLHRRVPIGYDKSLVAK